VPETLLQPPWVDASARREGRYVIGPLLGHGGMGEVFEAWDPVLARPVALKILKHLEPAAMLRFMHEAQLHARIDGPGICRIYDVDASGGSPRIAMQLIRGPNLEDASSELSLEEIVDIMAQVAETVEGAHRQNLIHRDIKPSNILLRWHGTAGWTPYLCDFGLAMALDGPAVTQPLALTGTPAYMAPEQVRGDRSLIGPHTDVYGMGSTLYFTLVGRPPCVSTTTGEMLRVKRERRFPSPRSLFPDVPPELEAILLRCLEPAPRDRYPSAAALAAELRRFQREHLQAPAAGASALRRWRRPLLVACCAGLALLGAGLAPAAAAWRARQARRQEQAQTLALEAAALQQGITRERLLPLHDLRPAEARSLERIRRLRALGGGDGSLAFSLGQAYVLLGRFPEARGELERAWAAGHRTADTAFLLARACGEHYQEACALAAFQGRQASAEAQDELARADRWLDQARFQTLHPRTYPEALGAFLHGDYARAAALARTALESDPWHLDSAVLAAQALLLEARAADAAGDTGSATAALRQSLELTQEALPRSPSEPRLLQARCSAQQGLATAALERGELSAAQMQELERSAGQALQVDPDGPGAQSAWLQAGALKALWLAARGRDPRPALDQAAEFYWGRTREPRGLDLRMDHLELYWLLAESAAAHGEDPGAALAEALKDPGHTSARHRDRLGDLLNLKARREADRGLDPRPTLEAVTAHFQPLAETGGCAAAEIAGKAWLIQAEWEDGHALDPGDSLRRAREMLRLAIHARPASAAAHALQGLAELLEARSQPDRNQQCLALARDMLRASLRLNPGDRELARLRAKLGG
jgi:serine/threonine-protein kinase